LSGRPTSLMQHRHLNKKASRKHRRETAAL
jgi:hypothetical protein